MKTQNTQNTENKNTQVEKVNTLEQAREAIRALTTDQNPITANIDATGREMVVYINDHKRADVWKRKACVRVYLKKADAEHLTEQGFFETVKTTDGETVYKYEAISYGAYPVSVYMSVASVVEMVRALVNIAPPVRKVTEKAPEAAPEKAPETAKKAPKKAPEATADKKPAPAKKARKKATSA